ncbi:NUDIX domain-containing protein [Acidovorax sp. DW039]|uniref:NUDIX hydrolase n=1 Tax=Acidovorax sp. DW039 TaxID=3095606 RepID=UPI0030916ECF|nr:NUDIX domain-containing protein [Acidovorax sp. DW039]
MSGAFFPPAWATSAPGPWLQPVRQAAQQPPAQPRVALHVAGHAVGSVVQGFFEEIGLQRMMDKRWQLYFQEHPQQPAWYLDVAPEDATAALNAVAAALRTAGRCGPWRDEQLAVPNPQGDVVATVERGAVRVLGIATRAVHLVGVAPDGRMWVQQRSHTKPNNPGMWDTLMGGMVSAQDTLPEALARETWEEAGLEVDQLHRVAHGGYVEFSRPSREGGGVGFMRERIDWFQAVVPEGMEPANQDGEVERFELLQNGPLLHRLEQGLFTPEAALVIAGYCGW